MLECAQEACRMLDVAGLLRQSSHGKKDFHCGLKITSISSVHAWNTCIDCHHFLTENIFILLESRKHKEKNWEENDFYDSDEDSFLDRTGSGWCENWFLTSICHLLIVSGELILKMTVHRQFTLCLSVPRVQEV